MRRPFLGLLTALVIVPFASRGQDAPTRACDLVAASPYDLTRPADIPGVRFDKVDPAAALPVCEVALTADPENPRLLFQMGRILQANKDDGQARTFYEKAAARGHAGAQNNLGVFYTNGRGGLPKNEEEAVRFYKLAADQGELNSLYAVGSFYATGRGGLPRNDEEAARLFKLTADGGIAFAQNYLGIFYETVTGPH
jgi:TPR repeat protein